MMTSNQELQALFTNKEWTLEKKYANYRMKTLQNIDNSVHQCLRMAQSADNVCCMQRYIIIGADNWLLKDK